MRPENIKLMRHMLARLAGIVFVLTVAAIFVIFALAR